MKYLYQATIQDGDEVRETIRFFRGKGLRTGEIAEKSIELFAAWMKTQDGHLWAKRKDLAGRIATREYYKIKRGAK